MVLCVALLQGNMQLVLLSTTSREVIIVQITYPYFQTLMVQELSLGR